MSIPPARDVEQSTNVIMGNDEAESKVASLLVFPLRFKNQLSKSQKRMMCEKRCGYRLVLNSYRRYYLSNYAFNAQFKSFVLVRVLAKGLW